jgi:hypothetical protein
MGRVWQSYDTHLKRHVALKIINPEWLSGQAPAGVKPQDIAARFRREAELGARFTHPGLPTLYDAQLSGSPKDLYMVWELVLGQDLEQILHQEGGRLPVTRALSLALQIADVLALTHTDPVIHRDLKPANIMVTGNWQVKLVDFGVAAVFGSDYPRLTLPGQVLGSIDYMAPEQFNNRGLIVPQTDSYALGCLLYQMLAGQPPFTGDQATVLEGHRRRSPLPVQDLRPEVSQEINALVMGMLAKDAEERPLARHIVTQLTSHCGGPEFVTAGSIPDVALTSGPAEPQVPLQTRLIQAQALFDGGHFGEALVVYNALGAELTTAGPDGRDDAAQCRAQAAHCHMRLGNQRIALDAYEALAEELIHDRPADDTLLLHVRCYFGLLQAASNQPQALTTLADIYPLLKEHLGSEAPQTTDVREALNQFARLGAFSPRDPAPHEAASR